MPRSEVNALTLVAIFIAAGLSGTFASGTSIFAQPLVNLVLLIVLFSFDREGYRDSGQSLGFAAVAGYCATRVLLPFVDSVLNGLGALPWFSIVWIVATLTCWAIDISRMGKRNASQTLVASPIAPQAPATARSAPTLIRDEPVRPQPVPPPPAAASRPVSVRPTDATSIFAQPPPETQPRPVQAQPVSEPAIPDPEPVRERTPVTVAPPPPQAVPIPQGSGKPATIYLNLVGEGLAVLRSVQAEHLRKDYYLIVEPMPPGENWEFQPGQVVRCQKRNLSSGKALVAVEEAPRAS